MAKPVSRTLIGLFVVGAVALGVAAVALFGSGKFFTSRPKYVMFFSGSVNGIHCRLTGTVPRGQDRRGDRNQSAI